MSVDLVRPGESLSFTVFFWDNVLAFARIHGWVPAGTRPPDDADDAERAAWDGNYVVNGGQSVTAGDAASLGEALARGLDEIPDAYAAADRTIPGAIDGIPTRLVPVGAAITPAEALSGENKAWVRRLAAFCRGGGFSIA
jgi:hypothetical protein